MSWRAEALCAGAPIEMFFPDGCDLDIMRYAITRGLRSIADTRPAKTVCRACPVRTVCLDDALAEKHRAGVFGGMDPYERWLYAKARGIQFDDDEDTNVD